MKKIVKNRVYQKVLFIFLLIILMLIPNSLLTGLIMERQGLAKHTQKEIAANWGGEQRIRGPVISIPLIETISNSDGTKSTSNRTYHILPDHVNIKTELGSETRKRGIYEAILYDALIEIEGTFNFNGIEEELRDYEVIHWDKSYFSIGIIDRMAIAGKVNAEFGGEKIEFEKGTPYSFILPESGIYTSIALNKKKDKYDFKIKMPIKGSESIAFEPAAKETTMQMIGDWPSPSFIGISPESQITEAGFEANWNLSEYNRIYPDSWFNGAQKMSSKSTFFGVKLIKPVDHYQKNMRSAKYALMIISMTFLIFFFFEVLYKHKFHPIQYSLVGLALSLFYFLLLAFSEHIGFQLSYLVASTATIGLICQYCLSIMNNKKSVGVLGAILTCLYAYIYILLQLETYALIAGSVGMFAILSAVMYLSRNVDWYTMSVDEPEVVMQV